MVSSSSPSSPRTTSADVPRSAKVRARTGARSAKAQPISPAAGAAGLVSGPSTLKTVECRFCGRSGEPERGVEHRREAETDAHLGHASCDGVRPQRDGDAERFEDVGATTLRRRRAVTVFDHQDMAAATTTEVIVEILTVCERLRRSRRRRRPAPAHRPGSRARASLRRVRSVPRPPHLHLDSDAESGDLRAGGRIGHDPFIAQRPRRPSGRCRR